MIDADSYTSVRLEVPNPYRLTETQSVLAQSTIVPWDMEAYPLLDRDLTIAGHNLFAQVAQQSYLGPLQLEVWLFGQEAIQIFRFDQPPSHVALGAMSGMPGVEQIAVVGPIHKRERNATHPMAHVYLEDKQGRWWFGAQALDENGMVVFDEPAISKLRSDGKPLGVGGWFALGRRLGLSGKLFDLV